MTLGKLAHLICASMLFGVCLVGQLMGQTVSSSLVGSVLDPANAVVPNATVTLTDPDTGAVRTVTTDGSGVFRFLNLSPGNYSLSVQLTGFKGLTQSQIVVDANQTRDLGKLSLALGNITDTISVTAESVPIQLASAEKSQAIEGKQLSDVTLRGRDMFGYLKLVPGVIDNILGIPTQAKRRSSEQVHADGPRTAG